MAGDHLVRGRRSRDQSYRTTFAYLREVYDQGCSFAQTGLDRPVALMRNAREELMPRGAMTKEEIAAITDVNVAASAAEEADSIAALAAFTANDRWNAGEQAAAFLSEWTGDAVNAFRGVYLNRLPAILCGQTMTATMLHDTLTLVRGAYRGLRQHAIIALRQAEEIFGLYPMQRGFGAPPTDWKNVLTQVSGVAAFVGAVASAIPGGQVVGLAAGIVSGATTVAANIVESPTHTEHLARVVVLEGDTVLDLYNNLREKLNVFLTEVANTEGVVTAALSGFNDGLAASRGTPGVEVVLHSGIIARLMQWESLFAPQAPNSGPSRPARTLPLSHLLFGR